MDKANGGIACFGVRAGHSCVYTASESLHPTAGCLTLEESSKKRRLDDCIFHLFDLQPDHKNGGQSIQTWSVQPNKDQILALLASVLYRRWHPPPMQEMHDTIRATEDKSIKAQTLSQLILKHGTRGWVDKMIEEAGPLLLHNVEQAAATLERLQKLGIRTETTYLTDISQLLRMA